MSNPVPRGKTRSGSVHGTEPQPGRRRPRSGRMRSLRFGVVAKELATLDQLSGGRLEPGLGAGFLRQEYEQAGLPFDPPGVRVSRLEESLRVLKGLLAGEPVRHQGVHYQIDDLVSYPPSTQRPHPPILFAAARPRLLAIAAREADIVSFQAVSTGG